MDEGGGDEDEDRVTTDSREAADAGLVPEKWQRDQDQFDRDCPRGDSDEGHDRICEESPDRAYPIRTIDFWYGWIAGE